MVEQLASPAEGGLAPVAQDLSIFLICGRVRVHEAPGITPVGRVLSDAIEADRLGFRRMWLSERFDLKDAGAILSAIAAQTPRLGVGTGALAAPSRHPLVTASLCATMQALHGPRVTLGLGRGVPLPDMPEYKIAEFVEYARTVRRLWDGEAVAWKPPGRIGDPTPLKAVDALEDLPRPEVYYCTYGGPKAAEACADPVFDGVMLYPFLTVEAVGRAVERIHRACEERDRDPASLRIVHPIVVCAGLDDWTTRLYAHARAVTYLEWPGHGEALTGANGWSRSVLTDLREHELVTRLKGLPVDQGYHRAELGPVLDLVPDAWMEESCALGAVDRCVERLQEYRDAGADEIAIYGSTPEENASLIGAWRERPEATA